MRARDLLGRVEGAAVLHLLEQDVSAQSKLQIRVSRCADLDVLGVDDLAQLVVSHLREPVADGELAAVPTGSSLVDLKGQLVAEAGRLAT